MIHDLIRICAVRDLAPTDTTPHTLHHTFATRYLVAIIPTVKTSRPRFGEAVGAMPTGAQQIAKGDEDGYNQGVVHRAASQNGWSPQPLSRLVRR
jgi:hypothetical protein